MAAGFANIAFLIDPSQRKQNTERLLQRERIPFLESLPCVESEDEVEIRLPRDVGIRIVCLFCVTGSAFERSVPAFKEYLGQYGLWQHLTSEEASFLKAEQPTRKDVIRFTWRSEALYFLLWAVQRVDSLPLPRGQTETKRIVSQMPWVDESPWPFIESLSLRSKSEILDASDLLYRLHWAVRDVRLVGKEPPSGLQPGVVQEWHHAVNWLTMYNGEDWDDVSTDT